MQCSVCERARVCFVNEHAMFISPVLKTNMMETNIAQLSLGNSGYQLPSNRHHDNRRKPCCSESAIQPVCVCVCVCERVCV